MVDYLIPLILLLSSLLALKQGKNGYATLLQGGQEAFDILKSILPSLVLLMTTVTMLSASGALEILSGIFSPILAPLGIPGECISLVLIRPISGSAALAVGSELMALYGVDSTVGRTAAIMLGSTETTFYALSVYCAGAGIEKSRYTLPAALFADFVGFTMAALTARVCF